MGLNRSDCNHFLDFRNSFLQKTLDPHLQCHLRHGASTTCTDKSDLHHAILGHVNQFHISAVCLKAQPPDRWLPVPYLS